MLYILVNNESSQFSCYVCVIHQTAKVCEVKNLALLKRVHINVKTRTGTIFCYIPVEENRTVQGNTTKLFTTVVLSTDEHPF
jgi:hypothetical protein